MITAILGGTGGMGQVLAREYKNHRDKVIITGATPPEANKIASELGVESSDNEGAIKAADEIVIAVPLLLTGRVIDDYRRLFTSDKTVYDIASVKNLQTRNVQIVDQLGGLEARTLSTHPMLGPGKKSRFADNNVVLIPTNEDSPIEEYEKFFRDDLGAVTVRAEDADMHDRYMAHVLALGHFLNYVSDYALEQSPIPFQDLLQFTGSTFLMNRAFGEFVLSSAQNTYGPIQIENKYAKEARESAIEGAVLFHNMFSNGDYNGYHSLTDRLIQYFTEQDDMFSEPIRTRFKQAVRTLRLTPEKFAVADEVFQWTPEELEVARKAVEDRRK